MARQRVVALDVIDDGTVGGVVSIQALALVLDGRVLANVVQERIVLCDIRLLATELGWQRAERHVYWIVGYFQRWTSGNSVGNDIGFIRDPADMRLVKAELVQPAQMLTQGNGLIA